MNLPLSLLVYDETGSTLLSAVMVVCGMLPDILFSVIAAPVIDRTSKKKWILSLDVCFMFVYAAMAYYTFTHPFHYAAYLIMVLVTGTLSVFYRLAYDAWYPDLIPVGLEQKGFDAIANPSPLPSVLREESPRTNRSVNSSGRTFSDSADMLRR